MVVLRIFKKLCLVAGLTLLLCGLCVVDTNVSLWQTAAIIASLLGGGALLTWLGTR